MDVTQSDALPRPIRDLLVRADSLCSLILYRESVGLTETTRRELDQLVRDLRQVTDDRGSRR